MTEDEDLARIADQEQHLVFEGFAHDDAWLLGCRLRQSLVERSAPVVIDVRFFGHPLFFVALPGSSPDNIEWVRRKGNIVQRFHCSSYAVGLRLKRDHDTIEGKFGLDLADYSAHGGSFPLRVRRVGVVGSVTVSGLAQREDHNVVVRALCEALGRAPDKSALP